LGKNLERAKVVKVMKLIGDRSCKHNAHSPGLRCAINPSGPCKDCPDFVKASMGERLKRQVWALDPKNSRAVKGIAIQILMGSSGGIFLGLFLMVAIVVPLLNQVIVRTHPCWPAIGVTQYCEK
jgi:Family of unknown function (DUF6464)